MLKSTTYSFFPFLLCSLALLSPLFVLVRSQFSLPIALTNRCSIAQPWNETTLLPSDSRLWINRHCHAFIPSASSVTILDLSTGSILSVIDSPDHLDDELDYFTGQLTADQQYYLIAASTDAPNIGVDRFLAYHIHDANDHGNPTASLAWNISLSFPYQTAMNTQLMVFSKAAIFNKPVPGNIAVLFAPSFNYSGDGSKFPRSCPYAIVDVETGHVLTSANLDMDGRPFIEPTFNILSYSPPIIGMSNYSSLVLKYLSFELVQNTQNGAWSLQYLVDLSAFPQVYSSPYPLSYPANPIVYVDSDQSLIAVDARVGKVAWSLSVFHSFTSLYFFPVSSTLGFIPWIDHNSVPLNWLLVLATNNATSTGSAQLFMVDIDTGKVLNTQLLPVSGPSAAASMQCFFNEISESLEWILQIQEPSHPPMSAKSSFLRYNSSDFTEPSSVAGGYWRSIVLNSALDTIESIENEYPHTGGTFVGYPSADYPGSNPSMTAQTHKARRSSRRNTAKRLKISSS